MSASSLALVLLTLGVLASAFVGIVAGLGALRRVPRSLLAAFAAGALLFLLFDLLKESAGLGQGILGDRLLQIELIAAFAGGALVAPFIPQVGIAWAWTAGLVMHGAGEGLVLGSEDAQTAELLRVPGALSFLLHKGIETFTIPIIAATVSLRQAIAIAIVLAATALGAALLGGAGVTPATEPLFLFAAGSGATAWAVLRSAKLADVDTRHVAALVAGALVVYAAGLLHEF